MELSIHGAEIKVSKTMLSNGNYVELEIASRWGGTIALALYGSAEQAATMIAAFPKTDDFREMDAKEEAA